MVELLLKKSSQEVLANFGSEDRIFQRLEEICDKLEGLMESRRQHGTTCSRKVGRRAALPSHLGVGFSLGSTREFGRRIPSFREEAGKAGGS